MPQVLHFLEQKHNFLKQLFSKLSLQIFHLLNYYYKYRLYLSLNDIRLQRVLIVCFYLLHVQFKSLFLSVTHEAYMEQNIELQRLWNAFCLKKKLIILKKCIKSNFSGCIMFEIVYLFDGNNLIRKTYRRISEQTRNMKHLKWRLRPKSEPRGNDGL